MLETVVQEAAGSRPAFSTGMLTATREITFNVRTDSATSRGWQRHGYIVPSFLAAWIICAWFVTWGDWKFFEKEDFCGYYDAEARSLIAGRFDVPNRSLFRARPTDISESARHCSAFPWSFYLTIWMGAGADS